MARARTAARAPESSSGRAARRTPASRRTAPGSGRAPRAPPPARAGRSPPRRSRSNQTAPRRTAADPTAARRSARSTACAGRAGSRARLLGEHGRGPRRTQAAPLPVPISCTKASSSWLWPDARADLLRRTLAATTPPRDDDDFVAQRRHLLHHVAREQHAVASSAGARAGAAGAHAITSSPLVGSSRMSCGGGAPARAPCAVFTRCPCEKPFAGGRANSPISSSSISSLARAARSPAPGRAARRSTQDVLARGQARVDAGAVRQHAERRRAASSGRRAHGAVPSIERIPLRSGASTVYSMRSVVDLPAPFGPSRPVTRRRARAGSRRAPPRWAQNS